MKRPSPSFFVAVSRHTAVLLAVLLSGCATVGPDYHAPAPAPASSWQARLPHGGQSGKLDDWWSQFGDHALSELLHAAETDNPTLEQASAAIASARAAIRGTDAAELPVLNGSATMQRSGDADNRKVSASTARTAGLDASWELDLLGGQRRASEAANAKLQASVAGWHDARVTLAAEVAQDYVSYRACRLTLKAQQDSARSQQETARLTGTLVSAGLASSADGSLASASAASGAAAVTEQAASCELLIKSLVALTGKNEAELRGLLSGTPDVLPVPAEFTVTTLPADLLRQRPDMVVAERKLAAASAAIGVAQAKRYPSLSLAGSITLSAASAGTTAPWTLGPALSLPLFDGGSARAGVDTARADYSAALATYHQTLRTAVKEVESALVNLDAARARAADVAASAAGYQRYFQATERNWRAGGASLLTLEQTRRDALNAEQQLIAVQRDHVLDWIALYKASGGDFAAASGSGASSTSQSLSGAPQ
jgi:NodT family efflux transporter outer membrane factor (OMF) lipoprotein